MNINVISNSTENNLAILKHIEEFSVTTSIYSEVIKQKFSKNFDVVITNIDASLIDTLNLLEMIHKANSKTKVIILSSNSDNSILVKSYTLGYVECIRKDSYTSVIKERLDQLDSSKNSS